MVIENKFADAPISRIPQNPIYHLELEIGRKKRSSQDQYHKAYRPNMQLPEFSIITILMLVISWCTNRIIWHLVDNILFTNINPNQRGRSSHNRSFRRIYSIWWWLRTLRTSIGQPLLTSILCSTHESFILPNTTNT